MTALWCNGQWLTSREFRAAPMDRGHTLGLGLFETLLAIDGRPIFLENHLSRLAAGCDRLGWSRPDLDFRRIIPELLERENLSKGSARVRITLTAGSGRLDELAEGDDRLLWMTASPLEALRTECGINLSPWPRNERSPLAGLKCASYAENLVALDHARKFGFTDSLFLNTREQVCEAATANIFAVHGGLISTPALSSGCLPGITRNVVIQLAERLGLPCEERLISCQEIHDADQVFLTSATRGPVRISRFEQTVYADGEVSGRIRAAWEEAVRDYCQS